MKQTKTALSFLLLIIFFFAGSLQLQGQEPGEIIKIKMKNANIHFGELLEKTDTSLTINHNEFGEHTLSRNAIKYTIPAYINKKGNYLGKNPNPYYYLYSTSGYGPKKKEAYYQNSLFFLHTFHFSLSNYYSISGGVEIASIILDDSSIPAFTLTQKISIPVNQNFHINSSLLYIKDNDWFFGEDLGIIYSSFTVGDQNNNFSLGLGTEINSSGFVMTTSGMVRIAPTLSIITENWIVSNLDVSIFSLGTRFIGDYMTVDIAVAMSSYSEYLPWLGASFPF